MSFAGAPKQPTREQVDSFAAEIRRKQEVFAAHGGTRCHCGGLIYPPTEPDGPSRYTCTHGGTPLTRAEIAAIWSKWQDGNAEPEAEHG
jgi:hypothetical protein